MVTLRATWRHRALLTRSKNANINTFRFLWVLIVLWCEIGLFRWNILWCRWPDQSLKKGRTGLQPFHVLLITDPQVLRPYKGWTPTAAWLKQYLVTLNLRKSWSAVRRLRPGAVVFLGDMLRHGSSIKNMTDYKEYYMQFSSIFKDPAIPRYYVPGNRDVGLGSSRHFSAHVRERFEAHFGPINQLAEIGNHTFVLLDAPSLVEEEYRRQGAQVRFEDWVGVQGGSINFIKSMANRDPKNPVILISHIPLFRPDAASCGPLREHGNIRRGAGRSYQNLLGRDTSKFVLESTRPSVIFSGDDHDYCEYLHPVPIQNSREVREVTVRSFSMAARIRRPGLQLLSLLSSPDSASEITHADVPCLLPNQSRIYTHWYAPLIVVTILILLASNVRRPRPPRLRGTHAWHNPAPLHLRDSDQSDSPDEASPPVSPIHFKSSQSLPTGLRSASTHTPNTIPSQPPPHLGGTPLLSATFVTPTEDDDGQDLHWPVSTPKHTLFPSRSESHGIDSSYFLPSPSAQKLKFNNQSTWLPSFSTQTRLTVRRSHLSTSFVPFFTRARIFTLYGRRRPRTWFGRFMLDMFRVAWPPALFYLGLSFLWFR